MVVLMRNIRVHMDINKLIHHTLCDIFISKHTNYQFYTSDIFL